MHVLLYACAVRVTGLLDVSALLIQSCTELTYLAAWLLWQHTNNEEAN
jgi:hypothetical protein